MTTTRARRTIERTAARAGGVILAAGLLTGFGLAPSRVEAKPEVKVAICHATSSLSNPYLKLWVPTSTLDGKGKNDHTNHHGGLFDFADPASNSGWGDIIPDAEGVAFSMNATVDGLGIFANGCNGPHEGSCPDGSNPVGGQCPTEELCPDGGPLVDGDCPEELESTDGTTDGGTTDGGTTDGGTDGGTTDGGTTDGGTTDGGTTDGGTTDGGTTDGGTTDGGTVVTDDGGSTDAGTTDGGTDGGSTTGGTDGGTTDGGTPDGGTTDGGTTDGGTDGGTDQVVATDDGGSTDGGTDGGSTTGGTDGGTTDGGTTDGGSTGDVSTDDVPETSSVGIVNRSSQDSSAGSGVEVQGEVIWGSTADHASALPLTGSDSVPLTVAGVVLVVLGVALAVSARLSRA